MKLIQILLLCLIFPLTAISATNEYYDSTGVPAVNSTGSSAEMRAEFNSIESGFIKLPSFQNTIADLQGYTVTANLAIVKGRVSAGDGGGGMFIWRAGNQSTKVTADPRYGVFVPPNSDLTGASGAWERLYDTQLDIRWFGAKGDGATDDTTAINDAIHFSYTYFSGGTVFIPNGTYIFTSITVKTGVRLLGKGGILKLKDNYCVNSAVSYYLIHNLTYERCIFENLIIDGNKANNASYLVADAITAVGEKTIVRGCYIYNPPDSGIMFSDVHNGDCSGNIVTGARDCGIYVNAAEGSAQGNVEVTKNIIKDCVYSGIACKRSAESVIIADNTITSCGNGITVEDFGVGLGGAPDHLLISNNSMSDIGYPHRGAAGLAERGISLDNSTNVICEGNKIRNVSGVGILLYGSTDVVVTGNQATGYVADPLTNNNFGFQSLVKGGVIPSGNTVVGNSFKGFQDYGCYVADLTTSIVTNNTFDSAETAFRMNTGCDDNTISYNRLTSVSAPVLTAGATGNIYQYNTTSTGATEWEKAGFLRSTSVATPVGNITPLYIGQLLWITTGGPKIFMAYGLSNTEWVQIN